jgi:hypothetical protein
VVKKTVKHEGGSIIVWSYISWKGLGKLYYIDEKMDRSMYCQILEDAFLGSLQDLGLHQSNILFQQNNDPKHIFQVAKAWFQNYCIEILKWLAQSADISIIEHVWDHLDKIVRARPVKLSNNEELWKALQEE